MTYRKLTYSICLYLFFLSGLFAQTDTLFTKKDTLIRMENRSVRFYPHSVHPGYFSLRCNEKTVPGSLYQVDFVKAILHLKDTSLLGTKCRISFMTYPDSWIFPTGKPVRIERYEKKTYEPETQSETYDFFDGMQADGFFTRGITGGNNMNASPVSKLDVKLNGKLDENIKLEASVYDDNAPYGYEGVTTTFKDINRVFIRISSENWQVHAGDTTSVYRMPLFAVSRTDKGIGFRWKNDAINFGIRAAVVKGKTAENKFRLTSGNYGPYLLTVQDEHLIFIVRGSEEVFLNYEKLTPGKDYRIIYETAEILLDPSLQIHTHDLLHVRFRYANRSYQRWTSFQDFSTQTDKHVLKVFHFNETDLKFKPLLFALDSTAVEALRSAKNGSVPEILYATPSEFDSEKILYRKVYTGNDFYFEYVSQPVNDTLYEVHFSYAGENQGEYVIDRYVAQGAVMRFVGENNGAYTPYFIPPTPENNHFTGFSWEFKDNKWQFETQHVWNAYAPNTFVLQDKYTTGLASRIKTVYHFKKDSLTSWNYYAEWHRLPRNYRLSDPIFQPGFVESWQISSEKLQRNNQYISIGTAYRQNQNNWEAFLGQYRTNDGIVLNQIRWIHDQTVNRWHWKADQVITFGNRQNDRINYEDLRHRFSYRLHTSKLGLDMQFKRLKRQAGGVTDSLSYRFLQIKNYWEKQRNKISWQAGWQMITTDSLRNKRLTRVAWERGVFGRIKKGDNMRFMAMQFSFTADAYRPDKNNWNFSWEGQYAHRRQIFDLHAKWTRFGSMIPKLEVIYKRVPDGQGQFQWIDYNGNGNAEQDEFEPAYYTDQANYIRVVLPSRNYEPAVSNNISLQGVLKTKTWVQLPGYLNDWRFFLSMNISNQTTTDAPWKKQILPDDFTKNGRYTLLHQIDFRPRQTIKLSYELSLNGRKENLYNGPVENFYRKQHWKMLWQIHALWQIKPGWMRESLSYKSQDYIGKNYGIGTTGWLLPVEMKTSNWRWNLTWKKFRKTGGNNLLLRQTWEVQAVFSHKKGLFSAQFERVDNRFRGQSFTPAGFVMLEGLSPGKNIIASLNSTINLPGNLRLDLFFQMRKSEEAPPVITANMNVSVKF